MLLASLKEGVDHSLPVDHVGGGCGGAKCGAEVAVEFVSPFCERLDKNNYPIRYRNWRCATRYQDGKHCMDLSKLNRDPKKILYVSGHAFESGPQQENCVPIKPYKRNLAPVSLYEIYYRIKTEKLKEDEDDTALLDLIPFLEYIASSSPADVRAVLQSYERKDIAKEFRDQR
ncbi:hypothetical protein Ddye_027973 [Dipteronia dyeriana]|uniref:Mitochondrial import inner membrane translocase subunit TIM50 n=1 Tax=Dipteronia dyeriana TaxID=168575 RepID=A0AAD9TQZ2_9ROSI|nr:hypothetical protein Ddye_027973 [Dipteronia dyeriana]